MAGADTKISVDPHGDVLLLIAGEKQRILQVSSKVMSLASPVWRTMLDPRGPFREANPDDGAISFLEDDPEALLILLLAAHLKYQEIPEELTYELLWSVCITCDKYDCIEIVRPWLLRWLAPLEQLIEKNGFEGFLFISWAIGDREMSERVSRKVAVECSTNTRMGCLTACGQVLGEKLPPAAVGQ